MFLKSLFCGALFLISSQAAAVPNCRPYKDEGQHIAANEDIDFAKTGVWVYWECIDKVESDARGFPIYQMNVVFARYDYGTKQSVGGKLDTALNSLVQFVSSWKRNVTLSTRDPSLAEIRTAFLVKYPYLAEKF